MTLSQYEEATLIKNQIKSIEKVLEALSRFKNECDPPTRMGAFNLVCTHSEAKIDINLNEGEVECIKAALESEKAVLQRKFDRL